MAVRARISDSHSSFPRICTFTSVRLQCVTPISDIHAQNPTQCIRVYFLSAPHYRSDLLLSSSLTWTPSLPHHAFPRALRHPSERHIEATVPRMPSLQILTLPLLVTFSLPLAFLAFLTTTFAASVLLLRVALVYAELAVYLVPQYLFVLLQLPPISDLPLTKSVVSIASSRRNSNTPPSSPPRTRRSRRLSSTSIASNPPTGLQGSASAISLPVPPSNPLRDFEGVGGWRLSSNDSDDESTDPWTRINSRLILPAESPVSRHHRRSLTGGTTPFLSQESSYGMVGGHNGGESGTWSPNTKRMRTPTHGFTAANTVAGEGYFMNASGQSFQSNQSTISGGGNGQGDGRGMNTIASLSGSPVSSKSSGLSGQSGLMMKGR